MQAFLAFSNRFRAARGRRDFGVHGTPYGLCKLTRGICEPWQVSLSLHK
jgi:hypothetical protein